MSLLEELKFFEYQVRLDPLNLDTWHHLLQVAHQMGLAIQIQKSQTLYSSQNNWMLSNK